MKSITTFTLTILAVLLSAAGGGAAFAEANAAQEIAKFESEVKGLLKGVSPSVVKVVCISHKKYVGSGVAIAKDYVITNPQLTPKRYRSVYVVTGDGKKINAKIAGSDRSSSIALLKLEKGILTPIKTGKNYEPGDWIALVGVFYSDFPRIKHGLLSVATDDELILNAAVMPGLSGGAVVNKKGRLVGIIRGRLGYAARPDYVYKDHTSEISVRSRSRDMDSSVAVPVEKALRIADELRQHGRVRKGWLGVTVEPDKGGNYVIITRVVKDSPAASAGLKRGDALIEIAGKPLRSFNDLSHAVKALKPEQKVKLGVLRANTRKSVLAVIGEAKSRRYGPMVIPEGDVKFFDTPDFARTIPKTREYYFKVQGTRSLGLESIPLTPELAGALKVKEGKGLLVSKVIEDSPTHKAGLKAADVIVQINDDTIASNTDLRKILSGLEDDEPVSISFYRDGKRKVLEVIPDKLNKYNVFFNNFTNKMKEVSERIEIEEKVRLEELKRRQERSRNVRSGNRETDENIYKLELERMKKKQEKMMKEMQELKLILLKKEKEKEKKKKDKEEKEKKQ